MSLKFNSDPPKSGSVVPPLKTSRPPEVRPPLVGPATAAPPLARVKLTVPPPLKTATAPPPEIGPTEKVQTFYKQLSHAATDLNTASDELAKPIKVWEVALKKLNLGVPAWVDISKGGDEPDWWDRGVGYTRLKDGWGIALRTRSGNYNYPDEGSEELWAFNDAPRWLRIEGVGKLPDLLGALLKQAEDTTKKLKAKVAQANELAEAITAVASELAALEGK
jgi:hypothetical protein